MNAIPQERVADAWATWLARFDWDVWATLTFRHADVRPDAAWAAVTELCRSLSREEYGTHLRMAVGGGPQDHRWQATPHFHVLIGRVDATTTPVDPSVVLARWTRGNQHAVVHRAGGGAAHYLAGHEVTELLVSCPAGSCRRRGRCRVALTNWPQTCPAPLRRHWSQQR